ncbi:MAG: bifunctional adenosylcobinamide kinase/adenosylcobinamide-phosphate guanylyltransferase [Candidatus Latescibacteria bacterium]|jgi:adenosylcobinamide kinase/adenosylcobinamide-phosphate guanylyltransferase|nr:bifunctional adenosylcobinamide kinase/adenosylcobinamide-phosphate guanylyltransferase [Candidatus Latescibacterota bacterium]
MGRIVMVTGGSRSGKSAHAQQLAERESGSHTFVATCPPIDEEMRERIRRHREDREGRGWSTVEETVDLAKVIRAARDGGVLLVDCLTLWINNLMYRAEQDGGEVEEDEIARLGKELVDASAEREGTTLFVTNELGIGIVPEHAMVRRYRDLVGRCNQVVAAGADRVILMIAGIPTKLKSQ